MQRRPRAGRAGFALTAVAVCAGLGLVVSSCGLPYDGSPQGLGGTLPAQLTKSPTTPVPPSTSPLKHGAVADLYFLHDHALVPDPEALPAPLKLSEVLAALEAGPQPQPPGFSTDVPVGSRLQALPVVKGVAHIAIDDLYYELGPAQAEIELGQVVLSVLDTQSLGVRAIQFYFNGSPVPVVTASGVSVFGKVTDTDYCILLPEGCPPAKPPKKKK